TSSPTARTSPNPRKTTWRRALLRTIWKRTTTWSLTTTYEGSLPARCYPPRPAEARGLVGQVPRWPPLLHRGSARHPRGIPRAVCGDGGEGGRRKGDTAASRHTAGNAPEGESDCRGGTQRQASVKSA